MRALKGSVPRAYKDHRCKKAKRYSEAVTDLTARLDAVPKCARPLMKEYGRLAVQLEFLNEEHDRAVGLRRLSDARRLRGELKVSRFLLLKLQARIESLAGIQKDTASDSLDAFFAAEEAES